MPATHPTVTMSDGSTGYISTLSYGKRMRIQDPVCEALGLQEGDPVGFRIHRDPKGRYYAEMYAVKIVPRDSA